MERRVLQCRCVSDKLKQRLIEIAVLALVFPGEMILFPNVGKPAAAPLLPTPFSKTKKSPCGSVPFGVG